MNDITNIEWLLIAVIISFFYLLAQGIDSYIAYRGQKAIT